jgi:hypothetical protein
MEEEQEIKCVEVKIEFEVPVGMGTTAEIEEWLRYVITNRGSIKNSNWYLNNTGEVDITSIVAREC